MHGADSQGLASPNKVMIQVRGAAVSVNCKAVTEKQLKHNIRS
jgi:hypothetical protein